MPNKFKNISNLLKRPEEDHIFKDIPGKKVSIDEMYTPQLTTARPTTELYSEDPYVQGVQALKFDNPEMFKDISTQELAEKNKLSMDMAGTSGGIIKKIDNPTMLKKAFDLLQRRNQEAAALGAEQAETLGKMIDPASGLPYKGLNRPDMADYTENVDKMLGYKIAEQHKLPVEKMIPKEIAQESVKLTAKPSTKVLAPEDLISKGIKEDTPRFEKLFNLFRRNNPQMTDDDAVKAFKQFKRQTEQLPVEEIDDLLKYTDKNVLGIYDPRFDYAYQALPLKYDDAAQGALRRYQDVSTGVHEGIHSGNTLKGDFTSKAYDVLRPSQEAEALNLLRSEELKDIPKYEKFTRLMDILRGRHFKEDTGKYLERQLLSGDTSLPVLRSAPKAAKKGTR